MDPKVVLGITPHGYVWKCFDGAGGCFFTHEMKRTKAGDYKGVEKGSIEDKLGEEMSTLAQALDDGDPEDICEELNYLTNSDE